jgi:hypothetical protein
VGRRVQACEWLGLDGAMMDGVCFDCDDVIKIERDVEDDDDVGRDAA